MAETSTFWEDKGSLWSQFEDDPVPIWLSTAFKVVGRSRDQMGEGCGLLLRWTDLDGFEREWVLPMAYLADDGKEMRRCLLGKGIRMASGIKARARLLSYFSTQSPSKAWLETRSLGWLGYRFVLPDCVLGGSSDEDVFLGGWEDLKAEEHVRGSTEDWKQNVSLFCGTHKKLAFSIIASFAAPLLHWCNEDTFGIHLFGGSSIGKTTALYVAQSVWGSPKGLHRWRATANALETVAASKNDCLLCLDEIAQLDPKQASEVAYMLGNGKGKQRATKDGGMQRGKVWRLLYLSTGEMSLANFVESNGFVMRGGMEVRQIDIPAEEGKNGILGPLPEGFEAAEYVAWLVENTRILFGSVGRDWIEKIALDPFAYVDYVENQRSDFLKIYEKDLKNGQMRRVAEKFGYLFGVGRLITKEGLTGWDEVDSDMAVVSQFHEWIKGRGGKQTFEEIKAINQVREFIARHGDSRFQAARGSEVVIRDRAGYWKPLDDGNKEYLVHPEIWIKDVCKDLSYVDVAKTLCEKGFLRRGEGRHWAVKERIPNVQNPCRMYVVKSSIFEGEHV